MKRQRIHWVNATDVEVDTFDDDGLAAFFEEPTGIIQDTLAIVINDPSENEAWVIEGDRTQLRDLAALMYDSTHEQKWDNDLIQFARLLDEIRATQPDLDLAALCESMDLSIAEIDSLFDRAMTMFERIKENP